LQLQINNLNISPFPRDNLASLSESLRENRGFVGSVANWADVGG